MIKYALKDTITDNRNGETNVYFSGKDGYIHDELTYVDAYTRKHFVERKIKNEISFLSAMIGGKYIDERHCIESKYWEHEFEIVEIECKEME